MVFCDWLLSLCIMFSRLIHLVACIRTSFFSTAGKYSTIWIYHILFIYSIDGRLFPYLTILNNGGMNIHVQAYVWTYIFISLGDIPKSGIAGSYGNSVFKLLRNCQNAFQSGCTILHSHQQCMRAPVFPHPCQYLLLANFLILVILTGVM